MEKNREVTEKLTKLQVNKIYWIRNQLYIECTIKEGELDIEGKLKLSSRIETRYIVQQYGRNDPCTKGEKVCLWLQDITMTRKNSDNRKDKLPNINDYIFL